jgi:hypothetical protein
MQLFQFIDLVSFLLGFAAATVVWWLVRLLKVYLPRLRAFIKHQVDLHRQRRLEGTSRYIRQESLRRAQNTHLARELFSLDDILIPPRLLAPPNYLLDPTKPAVGITNQLMPYLPDWPEFSAPFPVDTLSLAQALSQGANIAIVGASGSGRSVALAHLASVIARHASEAQELTDRVPIFLHALDMEFPKAADLDPIETMVRVLSKMVPVIASARLHKYTQELFTSGNALVMIDGMDELPQADLQEAVNYLQLLNSQYPKTQIALTASFDYLDGLSNLGVFPLAVAAWNTSDRQEFIEKWSSNWSNLITPEVEKRMGKIQSSDPLLLKTWLTAEPILQTPLEWTLKVWSAFARDSQGPSNIDSIHSYVIRLNHKNIPFEALSDLAYNIYCSGFTALPYDLVEKIFTKYNPEHSPAIVDQETGTDVQETETSGQLRVGQKKPARISSGANALNLLLENGLLQESPSGLVRFSHLQIAGYLASLAHKSGQDHPTVQKLFSSLQMNTLHFLAVQGKVNGWIKHLLEQPDKPLYRNMLMVSRWLSDAPKDVPWRSPLMRMLIQMAMSEQTPVHMRARCLAAVITSNDEGVAVLLKQLLESESDILRQFAAIGCGASLQTKMAGDLIKRLNDPNPNVSLAACLSLGSFGTRMAFESMIDLLNTGEEGLQLAAAATLARIPAGAEVLRQAALSDQLLVRRAAIAGLAHIRTEWSVDLLEKLAVEDAQWVIQNAASEALEAMKAPATNIPQPLPQPDQAGWLINYAGKHGRGIVPGEPATEYILAAVHDGTPEERLHALQYLISLREPAAVTSLYNTLEDTSDLIQEAGYYALWQLSASGVEIPNQFDY